jgi:RNA polymerase sigma factor (sigma-70 family)
MCDDVVIIRQTSMGDDTAFGELVRRYQGLVFALAYHYVRDFQDAEEVAQDVFMRVYRHLDTLREPRYFPKWLRSVVHNESMMYLRSRRRAVATCPLESQSPEMLFHDVQRYTDIQRRDSVMDALEELSGPLRLLVELRYLGGYTSQEIGELLGIRPGTVRYRLHEAIKALREGFRMVERELNSQQLPEDFAERVLESLGRLKGRVIDTNGQPLGNIQLELDQLLPGKEDSFSSRGIRVDGDGTFSVDIPNWGRHRANEVDTGEFHIGLYGIVDGAIRHAETSAKLKIGEQASGIVLDLRESYYPLRIRVVDPEEKSVENARVSMHFRYPDGDGHGFSETYDGKEISYFVTDAEGLTPELHLSDFRYLFEVTAAGFRRRDWRYEATSMKGPSIKVPEEIPEDGIFRIRLEPGGRITGRVVDSKGTPITDAKVAIRSYRSDGTSRRYGRYINLPWNAPDDVFTDDEGRFAVAGLEPVGAYSLHAYHEKHGVDCLLDVPVGTNDAVLHLMPVVSLRGIVLKNSKPVAILERDFEPALGNRIAIGFVESKGTYAKFNDKRLQPYQSCRIHIFTDESGVFQVDHLFPYATYKLTIPYEGKEYIHTVTLDANAVISRTFDLK